MNCEMYFSQNSEENRELQDINSELHEKSWTNFISIWEKKTKNRFLRCYLLQKKSVKNEFWEIFLKKMGFVYIKQDFYLRIVRIKSEWYKIKSRNCLF